MIGQVLGGRYAARSELGRGGNAKVLLAEDLKLGRAVALKVLVPSTHTPRSEAVQRLEREARVAASIAHPNVCTVTDIGQLDDGSPFLVMELLSGETLADRLERDRALPLDDVLQISRQLLTGLDAAHRRGIVHRDLKPANVFLVDLGLGGRLVKILDFGASKVPGLAKESTDGQTLTRAGLVVGTIPYMAPEQIRGIREFDTRTDVYACGLIVFEMLTGGHPFGGLPLDEFTEAMAFKKPPRISEVAPNIPGRIGRAVDDALAAERNHRHADARAFYGALFDPKVLSSPSAAPRPQDPEPQLATTMSDWEMPTRKTTLEEDDDGIHVVFSDGALTVADPVEPDDAPKPPRPQRS